MSAVMEGSTTYLQWLTADASDTNVRFTGTNDGTNGVVTATTDFTNTYMKGFSTDSADNTCLASVAYVKGQLESEHPKESAIGSSTDDVALATLLRAGDTFDSRTLVAGDRILLLGQTATDENGPWVVNTAAVPTRPDDFNEDDEVAGASIWVTDGAREGYHYVVTTPITSTGFTLGTNAIALTASQSGTYTAGNGMDLVGSEFSADLKANGGLVIESGEIAVDLAASSITNQLAYANLATLATGDIIVGNAGTATATTLGGDATIAANGALTIGSEAVDSGKIANLTIVNGDISASADIALSKLLAGTDGQIIVGAATTGVPTYRTVTGDVSISNTGVTAIQTDAVEEAMILDNAVTLAKLEDGTSGDVLYYGAAGAPLRLAKGSDGQVLTLASGLPAWSAAAGGTPDDGSVTLAKMDSFEEGSIIVGADDGGSQDPVLLAHGSANTVLYSNGTTLAYSQITSDMITAGTILNADVNASAAIDFSKLATLTDGNLLVGNGSNAAASVAMSGDATIVNTGAVTLAAAQTNITSIYAADLAIGNAATEERVVFDSTANEVEFYANNVLQNRVTDEGGTGKFYIRGSYQVFSDMRIKGHFEDVDDALDRIDAMSCQRYRLKRRDGTYGDRYEIGQVAQTTFQSCPELITTTDAEGYDDLHTINYGGLSAIATEGVKRLHAKHNAAVAELRAENATLRDALVALAARVAALE